MHNLINACRYVNIFYEFDFFENFLFLLLNGWQKIFSGAIFQEIILCIAAGVFLKKFISKNVSIVLRYLAAAVIIFLLVRRVDVDWLTVWKKSPYYLLTAAGLIALQNILTACRWYFLLRAVKVYIPFYQALSLTMQGLFWMLFLPGGTLGGDVVKATLAVRSQNPEQRAAAVCSVVIDRLCGLAGLLLLSVLTAVMALIDGRISANLRHFLLVMLIVAPMGLLALCGVMLGDKILRIKWFEKLFQWGDKLTGHTAGKVLAAWGLYRAEWKKVLLWAVVSALGAFPLFIAALNCIASAVVCSCGVHDFDASVGSLLCGSAGELAGILPLTPGGTGVRDAAFAWIYESCGLDKDEAIQIPLIFTTLTVAVSLSGGICALITLLHKKAVNKKSF